MKTRRLTPLLLLLLVSCGRRTDVNVPAGDMALSRVTTALEAVTTATTIFQDAVIQVHNSKQITEDQARGFMQLSLSVSEATLSAARATQGIAALDLASRQRVDQVMKPVIDELSAALTRMQPEMSNLPEIAITLEALRAALTSVHLLVAVGNE